MVESRETYAGSLVAADPEFDGLKVFTLFNVAVALFSGRRNGPEPLTAGQALVDAHGHYPGFDIIRLCAAATVVVAHAPWLATGRYDPSYALSKGQTFLGSMAVCAFFVVSGFLVTESFFRSHSLTEFAAKRALRIFPALVAAVLLCACLVGPAFTTLPLKDYLSRHEFLDYFRNILLQTRYSLPGVFTDHMHPIVNGSLWTIRYEVLFYAGLGLAGTVGIAAFRGGVAVVTGALILITGLAYGTPREVLFFSLQLPVMGFGELPVGPALRLAPYFLVGVSAYLLRDLIRLDVRFALLAGAAIVVGLTYGLHDLLFPLACGYICIYLGLHRALEIPMLRDQDYSYGIYVYSFPIQQAAIVLSPWPGSWMLTLLVSAPVTVLAAIVSWNVLEKPCLRLKKWLRRPDNEKRRGV